MLPNRIELKRFLPRRLTERVLVRPFDEPNPKFKAFYVEDEASEDLGVFLSETSQFSYYLIIPYAADNETKGLGPKQALTTRSVEKP